MSMRTSKKRCGESKRSEEKENPKREREREPWRRNKMRSQLYLGHSSCRPICEQWLHAAQDPSSNCQAGLFPEDKCMRHFIHCVRWVPKVTLPWPSEEFHLTLVLLVINVCHILFHLAIYCTLWAHIYTVLCKVKCVKMYSKWPVLRKDCFVVTAFCVEASLLPEGIRCTKHRDLHYLMQALELKHINEVYIIT